MLTGYENNHFHSQIQRMTKFSLKFCSVSMLLTHREQLSLANQRYRSKEIVETQKIVFHDRSNILQKRKWVIYFCLSCTDLHLHCSSQIYRHALMSILTRLWVRVEVPTSMTRFGEVLSICANLWHKSVQAILCFGTIFNPLQQKIMPFAKV